MNISFDFDGTLMDDFDGSVNSQKEEIQSLLKKYKSEGHNIFIITKRYGPDSKSQGLGNEHLIVLETAKRFGVPERNVFFTNRHWKMEAIQWLNVQKHFENSPEEAKMISESGIKVIPIGDPYWRDLVY